MIWSLVVIHQWSKALQCFSYYLCPVCHSITCTVALTANYFKNLCIAGKREIKNLTTSWWNKTLRTSANWLTDLPEGRQQPNAKSPRILDTLRSCCPTIGQVTCKKKKKNQGATKYRKATRSSSSPFQHDGNSDLCDSTWTPGVENNKIKTCFIPWDYPLKLFFSGLMFTDPCMYVNAVPCFAQILS